MSELTNEQRIALSDQVAGILDGLPMSEVLNITVSFTASVLGQWLCQKGVPEERAIEIGVDLKRTISNLIVLVGRTALSGMDDVDDPLMRFDDD